MWTRAELKTRAKNILSTTYWKSFVISLVLVLVGADGGSSGGSGGSSNHSYGYNNQWNFDSGLFTSMLLVFAMIALAFILFRILVGYALEVGGRRYFKQAAQMDVNMGYLGYAFNRERYGDVIKSMLYKGVLNFLWYLLLIIPGVVKSYAYSMVPYILADNPNIGYARALELSNQMTEGHKFDMFILDLSFLGWYILGSLLFLIGIFFVKPYEHATKAELYLVLRRNAMENGFCTPDELLV